MEEDVDEAVMAGFVGEGKGLRGIIGEDGCEGIASVSEEGKEGGFLEPGKGQGRDFVAGVHRSHLSEPFYDVVHQGGGEEKSEPDEKNNEDKPAEEEYRPPGFLLEVQYRIGNDAA